MHRTINVELNKVSKSKHLCKYHPSQKPWSPRGFSQACFQLPREGVAMLIQ